VYLEKPVTINQHVLARMLVALTLLASALGAIAIICELKKITTLLSQLALKMLADGTLTVARLSDEHA
jgi:hypothetical protein